MVQHRPIPAVPPPPRAELLPKRFRHAGRGTPSLSVGTAVGYAGARQPIAWIEADLSIFNTLSQISRRRKLELLCSVFPLSPHIRVLDVGGELDAGKALLIENHPDRSMVTVVNLREQHVERVRSRYPEVRTQVADARKLPFSDNEFDLVFSNAVIEHVGSLNDQQQMASEVMRVGRNWFVTTPNRWFPFEFHLRLPMVSWLPAPMMLRVANMWSYDHVQRRYRSGIRQQIRLLTRSELEKMFPGSRVDSVRVTIWPETLVVVGGEALEGQGAWLPGAPRASHS